jgi:glycosyltransferase involved in cell wall biosynthesis
MFCECIVVAESAPGPNFIIENNETGIIVSGYNIIDWVNRIKYAFENKSILAEKAKKKIINQLTWEAIGNQFIDLLDDLDRDK